ncbi:chorismate mutase [Nitrospirillum viridazoti]|uniref:chorismate mutase n=1 Tax=Nitrospirillum amazonense TaxID=28077 RepID=A0A560IT90_9PROT|nr:chorismate mutase [Nitrospirillum amazonense]TWB62206.1 chorismate mutase [Nitrospirillum amazonense]
MPPASPSVDALRREIDEIDAAIHDLIMRRARVVERIAQSKAGAKVFIRPGREAGILRRLVARHQGSVPVAAIVRIWREMIAAMTLIQGPFAVAVYAPDDDRRLWDIARDHYGTVTPLAPANTAQAVLRALAEGSATVGVVPVPEEEETDPWWRFLISDDTKMPKIIGRLPFCSRPGQKEGGDALILGAVPLEATGQDHTLLGVELAQDMSRGRLKDMMEAVSLPVGWFRIFHLPGGGGSVHLIEVEDFVDGDDARLGALAEKLGDALVRVLPVGAYALPITLEPRKA